MVNLINISKRYPNLVLEIMEHFSKVDMKNINIISFCSKYTHTNKKGDTTLQVQPEEAIAICDRLCDHRILRNLFRDNSGLGPKSVYACTPEGYHVLGTKKTQLLNT